MRRREFIQYGGLGLAALALPAVSRAIAAVVLGSTLDGRLKKSLADAALEAARAAGATYCDVRIGRYLNQALITREDKVQSITSNESLGVGIRVLAQGTWGFAATSDLSSASVAAAARQAVAVARANARVQSAPVQLAPTPGLGEVSWRTPIVKNAMDVPIKDKVDLLLSVNAAAVNAGASFAASRLFVVNEQKYFASSDGSYIDQDVHRIWAPFTVTAVDKASGKFRTRDGLASPMGMGYEFLDADPSGRVLLPAGVIAYSHSYDMVADAIAAAKQAREKLAAPSVNLATRLVARERVGMTCAPSDVAGFLDAADHLRTQNGLGAVMGRRGRAYAEKTFRIEEIAGRFEELLGAAPGGPRRSDPLPGASGPARLSPAAGTGAQAMVA